MEIASAIESLFSTVSITDDMSANDISGSFVAIHDELPSFTKKRRTNSKNLQNKEDPQALDESRIYCLEFMIKHLPDRPNFFSIHSPDDKNAKFSRDTVEIMIQFIKNMTPTTDIQKQNYHGKAHLVGYVSQALAKLVVVNIDIAYDMQLMGTPDENATESKQLGSAAKQKQFLSLCRKVLTTLAAYASFEQERLHEYGNANLNPDGSCTFGVCSAISELLCAFARRDIRLQTDQIESLRTIALKGMLLPPTGVDAHIPTMLTCGTVYAALSSFETSEKHANLLRTLADALQILVDQCYMLIPEEHDPRKLYLTRNDKSDATRLENIARENKILTFLNVIDRKRGMIESDDALTLYLSAEEYKLLFKSISHCLLRFMSTTYQFMVQIEPQRMLDLIRDAVLLDPSIYVINYRPRQKTVSVLSQKQKDEVPMIDSINVCLLHVDSFKQVINTIHLNILKNLTAFMLACNSYLLPYVKSISIILVQEAKKWCVSNESSSKQNYDVFAECIRAITVAIDVFGPCVSSSLSQPLLPILNDQLFKFHHSCIKVLSTGDALSAAEVYLEDFSFSKKKKKKKKASTSQYDKRILVSFRNFIQATSLTLKLLKRVMSDTRVFISMPQEGENTIDVLSNTIDLTSVMISSITLWHEQHTQRKISPYHTYTTNVITEMYDALIWTLLSTCNVNTQSPFLPHIVNLLKKGVETHIPEMVSICSRGLLIIDSYLHPRSAPIYIPPAESIHVQQLKKMEKEERENRLLHVSSNLEQDEDMNENDDVPQSDVLKTSNIRKEREHEKELEEERHIKLSKLSQDSIDTMKEIEVVRMEQVTNVVQPVTMVVREQYASSPIIERRASSPVIEQPVNVVITDIEETVSNVKISVTTLNSAEIEKAFDITPTTITPKSDSVNMNDDLDVEIDDSGDDPLMNNNTDLNSLDLQF